MPRGGADGGATTIEDQPRSLHPPLNMHPLRLSELEMFRGEGAAAAAANGEDDYSPSASTISTKASLAVAKTRQNHLHSAEVGSGTGGGDHVGRDGGGVPPGGGNPLFVNTNKYPPTPNMVSHQMSICNTIDQWGRITLLSAVNNLSLSLYKIIVGR